MPGQRRLPICTLVVSLELLLAGFLFITQTSNADRDDIVISGSIVREVLSPEELRRQMLIGEWEDDFQGGRQWELREDGTGTMVVHLEGLTALLYAPKLTFEQQWRVEGEQLVGAVTSGEPRTQVDIVLRLKGDSISETILELTDDRLVVDGREGKFEWRRVTTTDDQSGDD